MLFFIYCSFNGVGVGKVGGLRFFWKSNALNINIIYSFDRFIQAIVHDLVCDTSYLITLVYAYPKKELQYELWSKILTLNPNNNPLLLLGDFNNILNAEENLGGNRK